MPIFRTVLFLLFHVASTLAFAQSNPRDLQEEDKFVRPILVVPPKFPKQEPTDKLPVEIRVSGRVNEEGTMESAEFSPLEGNESFIGAIKDVLPLWRFRPAVDQKSCAPVASNGVLLVWFEEKNGSPSVSVSMPKKQPASEAVAAKPRRVPRIFEIRPKVDYPSSARSTGMEGSAELLFQASHQGDVLQTNVLYSIPNKVFGESALFGSRHVKFSSGAPDEDAQKTICILLPFRYCLTGGATYPDPACGNRNR